MMTLLLKELGVGARLGRTYVIRAVYSLLMALAVGISLRWYSLSSGAVTASQAAQAGRMLFTNFTMVQFFGVTVFSLLAGADFVVREIRADTLGLLVLTSLSGRNIVGGKWLAAIAQSGYLMLSGLPVLAASVYLGGVGVGEFLASFFGTAASSMLAAALSIWMASGGRNPYGAGALAGLWYLGYSIFCATLEQILPDLGLAGCLHPLAVIVAATPGSASRGAAEYGWITVVPITLGLSWLILGRAGTLLTRPAALAPRNVRTAQEIVDRRTYLEIAAENLGTRVRDVQVWDRCPLLWKDVRTRAAAHLSYELRLGLGLFLWMLFFLSLTMEPGGQVAFFHFLFPVALFLALSAGSAHFFRDREGGRDETLRVLPVSGWEIVSSKLISGPASPEGLVLLFLVGLSLHPYLRFRGSNTLFQAALASFLFLLFAYALGSLASLLIHKTRFALLGSGIAVLGILAVLPGSVLHPYAYLGEAAPILHLGVYSAVYLAAIASVLGVMLAIVGRRRAG